MSLAVRQAQNVSEQAVRSQNTSSILKETASKTEDKVDNELSNLLDDTKKRLELIRAKIRNVSNDLAGVQGNFQKFDDIAGRIGKCSLCASLWPLVYFCTTTIAMIVMMIVTMISDNVMLMMVMMMRRRKRMMMMMIMMMMMMMIIMSSPFSLSLRSCYHSI